MRTWSYKQLYAGGLLCGRWGVSGRTNQVTGQILCFTASKRQARDGEALQLQKKQTLGEARRGYPRFEVGNERLAQDRLGERADWVDFGSWIVEGGLREKI